MSQVEKALETAAKWGPWYPMAGQIPESEAQKLGIVQVVGHTFHAIWPFGRPLILQRERAQGWSIMPETVQKLAFAGFNFHRGSYGHRVA